MSSGASLVGRPVSHRRESRSGQGPQWLITFADLAAVLVAFFVLMFAMSEVDTDRWNGAVDALDREFDVSREMERAKPLAQVNITQLLAEDGLDLGYLRRVLAGHISDQPVLAGATLRESEDSLVVTLPAGLLFESGGARISDQGRESIFVLAGALSRIENNIEVIGHADPRLIDDVSFDTNWELSLARAASVARAMTANGISRPIRIVGAGASRFDEIDPELPMERRLALARRVDIVVRDRLGALR
ncbi:MAG: OmpA family protein [Alphaproteobacteria bacterium]|nr:OmpA family protein [Alphaproteobacteria bacterium]